MWLAIPRPLSLSDQAREADKALPGFVESLLDGEGRSTGHHGFGRLADVGDPAGRAGGTPDESGPESLGRGGQPLCQEEVRATHDPPGERPGPRSLGVPAGCRRSAWWIT